MTPEKALDRLKLVEETMLKDAQDIFLDDTNWVVFTVEDFSTMLEELQAVIREIEREMAE